jgi:hypothetical protein
VSSTPDSEQAALRALYEGKARTELAAADALAPGSDVIAWRGCLTPVVAIVKGLPGPAEASGGAAVSGPDGDAVEKALAALGHDLAHVFFTLSRPDAAVPAEARKERIRAQIEAVDAPLVVALDPEAARDLASAYALDELPFGQSVRGSGRRFVACEGLEASLPDEKAKRRVWEQLAAAAPEPPVF